MSTFLATHPQTEDYWRGIILLGRNVATYKLALAQSLLEISLVGKTFVTMEELAIPYTRNLTEHLRVTEKQITSKSSKFLEACRQFNLGKLSQTGLVDCAVNIGFNNVIDAFHIVNQGEIQQRFFIDDRSSRKGITLTDELLTLAKTTQASNLPIEVEARWRLVETAWSLALPPQLLALQYDENLEALFVNVQNARINVTSCRDALNGYQKGRCFYCFREIIIERSVNSNVDVDHFFPITLAQYPEFMGLNLNGVWNLVLSCSTCNRGQGGKFARVPTIRLLERFHTRNQFYIESTLPLRETMMNQLGATESARRNFLQQVHRDATTRLLHPWEAPHEHPPVF